MFDTFLHKKITLGKYNFSLIAFIWVLISFVTVLSEVLRGADSYHNYYIYQYFYQHAHAGINPYVGDIEKFDCHYGPLFSVIIFPFTLFTPAVGCVLWSMANAFALLYAINQLPISFKSIQLILLISLIENLTSTHNVQFNGLVTAWMILAYVNVQKEKDWAAAIFIILGSFTKIYGITGLTFFLFSKHKAKFVLWCVIAAAIAFCLPMLFSSVQFIIDIYPSWLKNVTEKNELNIAGGGGAMQDISLGGLIRRVLGFKQFDDKFIMLPFMLFYILPLFKKDNYKQLDFGLYYLALSLISVVVISSSSESPTYVIAVVGCAIWFVLQKQKNILSIVLISLLLLFTSMSSTDIFPRDIRIQYFYRLSLKAFPCVLIWLYILYQLNFKKSFE